MQNTVISYVGIALGFVITIIMVPKILTTEQYGLTRVLLSLAVVGTQFSNFGITNTVVRFFPYFRDKEENHHGIFFLTLMIPLCGFILFGAMFIIFRENITHLFLERSALLVDYYWYLLPLTLFILYFNVQNYFVRALYDTVMASFLNEVFIRVLTAILLIIYFLDWITFNQFMIIFVVNYGIITTILFLYTLLYKSISLQPDFNFLSRNLIQKMFKYGLYAFWGGVASIIVSNIDIIMLSSLAGLDETGIYAIAFYVGSVILVIRSSVHKISASIISSAFKDDDYELIRDIYKRSSLNQIIGGGLLFCGIITNLDNLMSLLPEAYAGGAAVIIVIAAANLFDMATGLNGAIILNSKHYRFDLYSTLFLIAVTVILNYLLIPLYGILGAAIGTATAIFLYNSIKVLFVWVRLSMQPFQWQMLFVIAVGAVVMFLSFQVDIIDNIYLDIVIRSTVITVVYLTPILALKISNDFNQLVFKAAEDVRKFFER